MPDFLKSLKVLDFTRLIPGPYATQILADMGAKVVKVEAIDGGDYARQLHPQISGVGTMFVALNRNKKSVAVNLKSEQGREIIRKLIIQYDIVFESFRSGVMDRLGIGYEDLKKVKEDLIYLSLSGYGQSGSYASRAAHDINCLALTGISSMIKDQSGRPVIPGLQIADMSSGLFSVIAILAALQKRNTTGQGSYIDLAMSESTLSLMSYVATDEQARANLADNQVRALCGEVLCYNYYETKDGRYMSVGALEPQFWSELCRVLETPELLLKAYSKADDSNPHFSKITDRFKSKNQYEWIGAFLQADACVEPVLDPKEVLDHPLFIERKMICDILSDKQNREIALNTPVDQAGGSHGQKIPGIGESNEEIFKEIGLSDRDIKDMRNSGIIS